MLLSFEQRQQQRVVVETPVSETKTVEGLRAALEQRKTPVMEVAPPVEAVSKEPVVQTLALDQELEHLLTPPTPADITQSPALEVEQFHTPVIDTVNLPVENVEPEVVALPEDEQRLADEEDRRFAERQQESYIIRSSLKVEAPCQSSLGQESTSVRHSAPEERIAVKPLRVRGRIRSGQTVRHPGDMIVEGSVHPSGEVAASGDIHVYGTGGGRLFAGIDGNSNACIYIAVFDAEIVSIAGHYHVIEDSYNNWSGRSIKISLEDGVLNFEEIRLMPQRAA